MCHALVSAASSLWICLGLVKGDVWRTVMEDKEMRHSSGSLTHWKSDALQYRSENSRDMRKCVLRRKTTSGAHEHSFITIDEPTLLNRISSLDHMMHNDVSKF
ncbi:hypothetical protein CEXT_74841 [Caerostris extrusa]|uniref:Secreted protein n=1 Tax=Caerostris extrusa TaxID=172846 RepID=A0AAV4S678_CAEEX|nr:hypothetical protein CEXT_74841 [Caerostris extrusa]